MDELYCGYLQTKSYRYQVISTKIIVYKDFGHYWIIYILYVK